MFRFKLSTIYLKETSDTPQQHNVDLVCISILHRVVSTGGPRQIWVGKLINHASFGFIYYLEEVLCPLLSMRF